MAQSKDRKTSYRLKIRVSDLSQEQAQKLADEFAKGKDGIAPDAPVTSKVTAKTKIISAADLRTMLTKEFEFERWRIILIFAVCWLPYIIACFPANLAGDSGTGISDFLKITNATPNNPWFQNLLMASFYSYGKLLGKADIGLFIYCMIQVSLEIALLSRVVRDIGLWHKPAGYCLLAVYCLLPVFPLFAFQMGKDSNFGLAVMVYTVYSLMAIRNRDFWHNRRQVIVFSLSIVLMNLFRNSAGWIPAIAFILYAVFSVKEKKIILTSCAVLAVIILSAVLPPVFGVPKVEQKESMSVPLQTMAFYAKQHPDDMTQEDRDIISQVYNYDKMLQKYDPEIVDIIKETAVFNEKTTGPYMRLWFQKFLKHPLTMLEGMWRSNNKYIIPSERCTIKPHVVVGYWLSKKFHENLNLYNNNPHLQDVNNYLDWWLNAPVLNLLVKIGLYTILLVLMMIGVLVFRQPKYYFTLAPLIMILIACLLSPVNGYYRYAYSMIASIPIVLTTLLCSLTDKIKQKRKPAQDGTKEAAAA